MHIGEKIKAIRKEKGIAQKELAEMMGVSAAMIAQYEAGKRAPKYETLNRFSSALGVSVLSLVDDEAKLPPAFADKALSDAIQAVARHYPNMRLTSTDDFYFHVGDEMFSEDLYRLHTEMDRINHAGMEALIAYAAFLTTKDEYVIGDDDRYYNGAKEAVAESDDGGGADA